MSTQTCKFYLQGRCKYGDRCWYQHDNSHSSPAHYGQNSTQYHYYAKPQETVCRSELRWSRDDVTQLLHLAREAAEQVDLYKMWPLTCVSFLKMKGSLLGWVDYSMEEVRFGAFAANKMNRFPQYQKDLQDVLLRAQNARNILLKGGRDAENLITTYLQSNSGGTVPGPSTNIFFASYSLDGSLPAQTFSDPAPGLFAQVSARATPSNQAMSTVNFGAIASSRPDSTSSFSFASVPQKPQASISQFTSSPSVFPQTEAFAAPAMFPRTPPTQTSTPLTFSSVSFSSVPSQPVAPPANRTSFLQSGPNDIYSRIQDLTDDELEQYRAATFTLGKIPTRPPPKELC